VAAHSALRIILARYLNMLPERIRFQASAQGKPGLAPGLDSGGLRFNLAHSGDLALVAVAAGREVGVDVEHFRPLPEVAPIAERYFSASEREALAQLAEAERPAAFFNIWACKEAFIKATGQGLSYPLQGFSVPLVPAVGQRPARVQTGAGQDWSLRPLAAGAGYAGAVVAEGLDWELRLWQY
jgi:4'-phosphopantetheinyl transferase